MMQEQTSNSALIDMRDKTMEVLEEYYYNPDLDVKVLAEEIGRDEKQFMYLFEQYKLAKETEEMPKKKIQRKQRVHLDDSQRRSVVERYKKGVSITNLADHFGCNAATIQRIIRKAEDEPEDQTVKAPETAPAIFDVSQIGIFLEGDFVTIRLPKKEFTRAILAGII